MSEMQKSRDKKEKGNHKIKIQSFFLSAISTFFLTVSILNIIFLGGDGAGGGFGGSLWTPLTLISSFDKKLLQCIQITQSELYCNFF